MILRLRPEEIKEHWSTIRYGVMTSIAPLTIPNAETIKQILSSLISEEMQCWCIYEDKENIQGYVVTCIQVEPITGIKTLFIYSVYTSSIVSFEDRINMYETLETFAKSNSCNLLAGISCNQEMINIGKKLGFNTGFTYLVKEV